MFAAMFLVNESFIILLNSEKKINCQLQAGLISFRLFGLISTTLVLTINIDIWTMAGCF